MRGRESQERINPEASGTNLERVQFPEITSNDRVRNEETKEPETQRGREEDRWS